MKKSNLILASGLLSVFLLVADVVPVRAASDPNPFSLGLRFALVFPSQDPASGFKSDPGFLLGATGLYRIKKWFRVGGLVEWERVGVSTTLLGPETSVGHFNTVSLIPVVEFRYIEEDLPVSPYLITGPGVNFNFLQASSALTSTNTSVSLDHTFAYWIAGGLDIFATDHFVIRGEAGWKMNMGEVTVTNPAYPGNVKSDFDASAIMLTAGFGLRI